MESRAAPPGSRGLGSFRILPLSDVANREDRSGKPLGGGGGDEVPLPNRERCGIQPPRRTMRSTLPIRNMVATIVAATTNPSVP